MDANKTSLGIGAGILAGALWGLVFLAPELTRGFTPAQLAAGRYIAYGVVAAVLVGRSWRRLIAGLSWREWRGLAWLGLTGNIVYYVLLAQAVQRGGVAMASIVIGLLPIVVTLVGSRDTGALPLRRLIPSLALSTAGIMCISWQTLSVHRSGAVGGLLCATGALVSWTIYAVGNSRWLARLRTVSPHEWNLLTGLVTGVEALLLAVPAFYTGMSTHHAGEWIYFAAVVTGIAIFCSIVGNGLWNYASRVLPLTLMGQMIVFETLFAAFYGFLWEQRWPTVAETAAMTLLVAGVGACALVHRPPPRHMSVTGGHRPRFSVRAPLD